MKIIMVNSNGIKIEETLPIPLFTSLVDTTQKKPHKISVQMRVGDIIVWEDIIFELPPT